MTSPEDSRPDTLTCCTTSSLGPRKASSGNEWVSVRAITFDLDDTLWDIWPTIAKAEERLHDWLASHYPRVPERYTTLELRTVAREIATAQPSVAHDPTAVRKRALEKAAFRCGYQDFLVEPAFEIFFAARNEVVFFEEVMPALERLASRYKLGAVTNGNADLGRIGLGHLFAFCVNSVDVGVAKPDAGMFLEAIRRTGVSPQDVLHVGDDPIRDVQGARDVGMRTCWVNRGDFPWPGGERADVEVATLEELEVALVGENAALPSRPGLA